MKLPQTTFKVQPSGFATKAIHVGQDPDQWNSNAVIPPIFLSSTYKQVAPGENNGFLYSRCGNPSRNILEQCLASLDNGKHAMTFASGIGAATAICSLLKSGDHIICSDDVYGGTSEMLTQLTKSMGIEVEYIDCTNLENVQNGIKYTTRMIWLESVTNPTMKVVDIQAVSDIAHSHNDVLVVVDNSFLSAYLQRPLEVGADISMYSITKFMNGHSDVIMGAAVVNNDDLHKRLRFLQNAMGIIPSPFDCYLVNRSLKTLALRMEQHSKSSLVVANFLENHPLVEKVMHPGLPSHPQHELALRQCYGHSGIMSFYLKGGLTESKKFLKSLKIFTLAVSLGGFESLTQLPAAMTHANIPVEQRLAVGISDNLIRLSIGLENVDDIIEDLSQALNSSTTVGKLVSFYEKNSQIIST